MANNTISQIKLGTTTYDICDYTLRHQAIGAYYKASRTVGQKTVNGDSLLTVVWDSLDSDFSSNKFFLGYLDYNTDSYFVFPVTFTQNAMTVGNRRTSSVNFTPTATQIWYSYMSTY